MKRLSGFIAGLALGLTAPSIAQEIEVLCQPVIVPPPVSCANALETHFATQGDIPNRCKIS